MATRSRIRRSCMEEGFLGWQLFLWKFSSEIEDLQKYLFEVSILHRACRVNPWQCMSLKLTDELSYNAINYISVFISNLPGLEDIFISSLLCILGSDSVWQLYFVMMPFSILLLLAISASAFNCDELDILREHTVLFCRVKSHGYERCPSKVLFCSWVIVPHGYPFLLKLFPAVSWVPGMWFHQLFPFWVFHFVNFIATQDAPCLYISCLALISHPQEAW